MNTTQENARMDSDLCLDLTADAPTLAAQAVHAARMALDVGDRRPAGHGDVIPLRDRDWLRGGWNLDAVGADVQHRVTKGNP